MSIDLDHLQVSQAVDAAHVETHHSQNDTQCPKNFTEWNDKHADRYETCGHHNNVIRISPENIVERIVF